MKELLNAFAGGIIIFTVFICPMTYYYLALFHDGIKQPKPNRRKAPHALAQFGHFARLWKRGRFLTFWLWILIRLILCHSFQHLSIVLDTACLSKALQAALFQQGREHS